MKTFKQFDGGHFQNQCTPKNFMYLNLYLFNLIRTPDIIIKRKNEKFRSKRTYLLIFLPIAKEEI